MLKLWTMTFMAVVLSWGLASAQEAGSSLSSTSMTQADWKVVLKNLKNRDPKTLKDLSKDNKSIRIEGPGTSGGGNETDAEFYYLAGQVFTDFEASQIQSSDLTLAKQAFEKIKAEKAVFFADKKLFLDGNQKTAINDYEVFVIVFDELRWNDSTFAQKRRLIVHELLGLAKAFNPSIDDSTYQISNDLFAKLDDANQKEFLKKSDYPKSFKAPSILNSVVETKESVTITKNGQSQACNSVDGEPTVRMEHKSYMKDGRQRLDVSFRIACRLADGNMFGHSNSFSGLLEIISGNLLLNQSDYGRFIMGWVSDDELLIKGPAWIHSMRRNTDGALEFTSEAAYDGVTETYRAVIKKPTKP